VVLKRGNIVSSNHCFISNSLSTARLYIRASKPPPNPKSWKLGYLRSIGKPSAFSAGYSQKPKSYLKLQLQKPEDKNVKTLFDTKVNSHGIVCTQSCMGTVW
jgi:hypothetical protein